MTFLNSILLGLAMGSGTVFSIRFGQKDLPSLREGILASFALLGIVTLVLNAIVFLGADAIIAALATPAELVDLTRAYLLIVFSGMIAVFLYNFFASVLRAIGNSAAPLVFLAVSAVLNIALDLWFVAGLGFGVEARPPPRSRRSTCPASGSPCMRACAAPRCSAAGRTHGCAGAACARSQASRR